MAYWMYCKMPTPAIATRQFTIELIEDYAEAAGYYNVGQWLQELKDGLHKTSRELNEEKVVELLSLECSFINTIVKHKRDMRSEKFFPKLSQVARAMKHYLKSRTAALVSDVSLMLSACKISSKLPHARLPSPALLRQLLLLLARSHAALTHASEQCCEAAVWLQCKLSINQRQGLALALFSVVSRIRALCLYLLPCLEGGYAHLSCLLCGIPLSDAAAAPTSAADVAEASAGTILQGLPATLSSDIASPSSNSGHVAAPDSPELATCREVTSRAAPLRATITPCEDLLDLGEVICRSPGGQKRRGDTRLASPKKKKMKLCKTEQPLGQESLKLVGTSQKRSKILSESNSTINLAATSQPVLKKKKKSSKLLDESSSTIYSAAAPQSLLKKEKKNVKLLHKSLSSSVLAATAASSVGGFSKDKEVESVPIASSYSSATTGGLEGESRSTKKLLKSQSMLQKSRSFIQKSCAQLQLPVSGSHQEFVSKLLPMKKKKKLSVVQK
ncbi:uncharacterized protein LOC108668703 [Hyalella azteca]|uniref:Uncharacterized protein LOC108668703 n=1 Tax=Hyalella azteca TaxID=294128 RepID=A0A8B7NCX1_HYAAZ|nr:uncharacterized protein LOC108668703 [Hyalella azteca]